MVGVCKKANEIVKRAVSELRGPTQAASPPPPAPAPANVAPSERVTGQNSTAGLGWTAGQNLTTSPGWTPPSVIAYQHAIWTMWTSDGCSTGITIGCNVWPLWTRNWQITSSVTFRDQVNVIGQRLSAAEYRAERLRWDAEARLRRVELDAAKRRAEDLLRRHLTEEQRKDLDQKGHFYLETLTNGPKRSRRRRYRIDRGFAGNIFLLDDKDSVAGRFCIHPAQDLPDADAMLAQKLLLEANEEEFLRVANFTPHAGSLWGPPLSAARAPHG